MENPVHLPTGHRFTLYLDEDGDYILESQQEEGLVFHGSTPNAVVLKMAAIIPEWESFKVWANLDQEPISPEDVMPTFENFQEMTLDSKEELRKISGMISADIKFCQEDLKNSKKRTSYLSRTLLRMKLDLAYSDPDFCEEACKLYKEFESSTMDILSRSDSTKTEPDAGE